ncbi:MAG TPA: DUF2961 domain-containing protein [Verrucomicrobiae bacterium]|nr:DUF2961 domain-containing protein [Verrucomicrobiae bacterium]
MNLPECCSRRLFAAALLSTAGLVPHLVWAAELRETAEPPVIPVGYDAFLQWEQWPMLRVGVRAYMRSTFDRTGGNHFADAAHYIRQVDDQHSVALDEQGPGILWFVRHNHWHGSPWSYAVDGRETIVRESSTADPTKPVENSIFLPENLFPAGLTYTWSVTKGADLSWVPIPFEKNLQIAYGRTRYGTGYFILWKLMPGLTNVSRAPGSWTTNHVPPKEVLELLRRSGTDIAPPPSECFQTNGTVALAAHEGRTLVSLDGTPSTIRRLAFRVPEKSAEAFRQARLRIWWDERPHPSVDAPVGLFFGTASLMRDEGQEFIVKSFPMTVRYAGGALEFATYFPMPFLKSARIALAETAGAPLTDVTWSLRTQPLTGPLNAAAQFHATYRDFPKPGRGHDLVLLDTTETEGGGDWCGHLVGTTYQFTTTGQLNTLEGDPRFYFDDSLSPQCQGTGSEEWGGGGDYWGGRTMTLPFAGHPVGRPPQQAKSELDRVHSAYRFLLTDLMPFGRNARITLEHGGENTSREHYKTVTCWYGVNHPGLVPTDEFDVGDAADEKLHDYHSPDATRPEPLSSRFEWGVDHLPVSAGRGRTEIFAETSDDGRRTRTWSEFTLKVATNNLGVLLRRRLDLNYPNQKARVLVSPVEGEPVWQEAGIWYTAGGNPAVFGDPLGLPKEQVTVNPEIALPAHIVWPSNRRWREDEFLLPRRLTAEHAVVRVRLEFQPVGLPLFPGHPVAEEAWTEFRYRAYSFVMPRVTMDRGGSQ